MLDLFREIGQTLSTNKLRTALTGIAVSWGIFMLIVLLGAARGIQNGFSSGFGSMGTDQIEVFGGITSKAYNGYKEGRRIKLKDTDAQAVVKRHGNHFTPDYAYKLRSTTSVISTQKDYATGYNGVWPKHIETSGVELTEGRFINSADMDGTRKVIVLPLEMAETLFGKNGAPFSGKRVNVDGISFVVVGVYEHQWERNAFIPFTTAKKLNGDNPEVNSMSFTIKDVNTEQEGEQAEQEIRESLHSRHDFDPSDTGALWVWNRLVQHLQITAAGSWLDTIVWIIGLLTMLSGIVGVSNIMFVSVRERTHEIGVRRAIGAKPRSIIIQIITESICITALFGYIGVVLGILVLSGLNMAFGGQEFFQDPGIDLSLAFEVTLVLVAAGCVAGFFPAMKSLKIKPVEALREE